MKEDQLNGWEEHFKETLNRPDSEEEDAIENTNFCIGMKKGHNIQQEMRKGFRQTEGNSTYGENKITTDMLKAEPTSSQKALEEIFNKIWDEDKVPEAWKKGVITRLPKEGNLSTCGNTGEASASYQSGEKIFCIEFCFCDLDHG